MDAAIVENEVKGTWQPIAAKAFVKKIYTQLSAKLVLEKQQTMEVTALFAMLGALLSIGAALMSMSWFNRIA